MNTQQLFCKYFFLIYFVFMLFVSIGNAQVPDFESKEKELIQQIVAAGKEGNFTKVTTIAKKGIDLATLQKKDSSLCGFHFFAGMAYFEQSRKDSALFFLQQAVFFADRSLHLQIQVRSRLKLIDYYQVLDNPTRTDALIEELTPLVKKLNNPTYTAGFENTQGNRSNSAGQYDKALGHFLKALEAYRLLGNESNIAINLNNIGNVLMELKKNQEAIPYLKEAISLTQKINREALLPNMYNSLGLAYFEIAKNDSARFFFENALALAQKYKNADVQAMAYKNLATLLRKDNTLATTEKEKLVEENLEKSAQISKEYDLTQNKSSTKISLGISAKNAQNYQEAAQYFLEALQEATQTGDRKTKLNALVNLSEVYFEEKKYAEAYNLLSKGFSLRDSIYSETLLKNTADLEAKYQSEQKRKRIQLLEAQKKLQTRNFYFALAGIAFVLIVLALLYRNYQFKQKTNLLLAEKNEELQTFNEELNSANEELYTLNERLEQANQAKTKLFGILSHDLRAPISKMIALLNIQRENPEMLSEIEAKSFQTHIAQSGETLLSAMEDILLWAKSQMQHFELNLENIEIAPLFEEMIALYQPIAQDKQITLERQVEETLSIESDLNFLRTILRNLLSNALKFTPENGKIELNAWQANGHITLEVADNGQGMSETQIKEILTFQGILSTQTGLGLKMTQEFVEKLGGKLNIQSAVGKGTNISVLFT